MPADKTMRSWWWSRFPVLGGVFVVGWLASGIASVQAALPTPPCHVAPVPPYPALDDPPVVLTGPGSGLPATLKPDTCVYWDPSEMSLVVMLSGRFEDRVGAADVLARFGAISRRAGMGVWSETDKKIAPMIEATAVTDADGETHRGDFTVAELADGAPRYFVQEENVTTGEVIYGLRARVLTTHRLVLTVENISPVKSYFIRLFDPGDLETTYYLNQITPGIWGYYSLSGIQETSVTGFHPDLYAHQAIAMFNLIATMGR